MDLDGALKLLGLSEGVSLDTARRTFRRLARQCFQGTSPEKSARRFVQILTAYEVIKRSIGGAGDSRLPLVAPTATGIPRLDRPDLQLTYEDFVTELRTASQHAVQVFDREKGDFRKRVMDLTEVQVSSYTSTNEFRDRVQDDVDAVIQREMWAFIQRLGRRSVLIEQRFRSWVTSIRTFAYEVYTPHSMLEYLSRPSGLLLSGSFFLVLASSAFLAMFMSPLPYFDKGPIPILAGIFATTLSGLISLWAGKGIYVRSTRKKEMRKRAVLMAQMGMDGFQVGAIPTSDAFSSGERAGFAGAGTWIIALWFGVEPVTGAIAVGAAALWGWATGKSLRKMKKEAVQNIAKALEPRLDDFCDGFAYALTKSCDLQLTRMRNTYLESLGEPRLMNVRSGQAERRGVNVQ